MIKAAINMIAVKPMELSELSQGLFHVQAASEKRPEMGKVVTIGEKGSKELPFSDLKEGDVLLYRKYGSSNFIVDGSEYAFIGFDDVVGKVEA